MKTAQWPTCITNTPTTFVVIIRSRISFVQFELFRLMMPNKTHPISSCVHTPRDWHTRTNLRHGWEWDSYNHPWRDWRWNRCWTVWHVRIRSYRWSKLRRSSQYVWPPPYEREKTSTLSDVSRIETGLCGRRIVTSSRNRIGCHSYQWWSFSFELQAKTDQTFFSIGRLVIPLVRMQTPEYPGPGMLNSQVVELYGVNEEEKERIHRILN